MKVKAKYLVIPIVAFVLGIVIANSSITPVSNSEGIGYSGFVCVWKNDELVECKHNIITNVGLNQIKIALGTGLGYNITNITIGNSTATQVVGDTEMQGAYSGCGLAPARGTYSTVGGANGAWNITNQWTSTCNQAVVNATGLYNQTGTGQLFAETTFTSVTLQNNDKLNVTWGIDVTST